MLKNLQIWILFEKNYTITEAAVQRCRKYAANLQDNTHAKVQFQKATLLKLHFGMGILL